MANLAEIVLSVGTHAVEIVDIPLLFADAVQPTSNNPAKVISGLKKQMLDETGTPLPGLLPLTSDPLHDHDTPDQRLLQSLYIDGSEKVMSPMTDWAWLNLAWIELPPFRFPLPESEWPLYKAALESSASMFDGWSVVPEWDSDNGHSFILNLRAQVAHRAQLREAINAGILVPLSPLTLLPLSPTIDGQPDGAIVTIEGLREYAARFHIGVRIVDSEPLECAEAEHDSEYEPFTPLFEAYFDLPLCALPSALLTRAKKIGFLNGVWDKLSSGQRRDHVSQWDYQHAPANQGLFDRAWWDYHMDASLWWARKAVAPQEAAAILCRFNPFNMKPQDPAVDTTDETTPLDYKRMLRVFEDFQHTQSLNRTLAQWLLIAQQEELKYHSWIDEWLKGEQSEAKAAISANEIDSQGLASPLSRTTAQNEAILAEIRACNYDPLKLPKAPAGKAGVKAEIRERLKAQTSIFVSMRVFNDAWQRLRDQGAILDG